MVAQKSGEERWVDLRTSQDHFRYLEVTAIRALKAEIADKIRRLLATISMLLLFYTTTHPHWGALLSCHVYVRQVISSLEERPALECGA